jgi:diguanylate cyclase (GGDEF)-like protein
MDRGARAAGIAGVVLMVANLLYLLIPNLFTSGSMERESYFLFVIWSLLGFVYFRFLLQKDRSGQLGRSIVVWISLFSLIVFVALVWLYQSIIGATSDSLSYVEKYYVEAGLRQVQTGVVSRQLDIVRQTTAKTVSVVVILLALSLVILIGIFRIMRQRAQLSELQLGQAKKLASTDPLTGVKNRTAFAERERLVDEQINSGTSGPFGIVVCDLNGLKYINDTYGHQTGDEWIRKTSKIICDFFSHSPVYRNGGDEFVVFLSGRDYENRMQILSDLHQQSVENIATNDAVIAAGIAEYVKGTDTRVHAVFARADAAMYQEKMLLKGMGAKSGR